MIAYLATLLLLPVLAFFVGMARYDSANCSGPGFDGECDVAAVEGLLWAAAAFGVACVAVLIIEVRLARRRRGQAASAQD